MAFIYVGVGKDYLGIQLAIDAASDGDLIIVDPAQYVESVTIDKAVSLRASTDNYTGTVEIRSPSGGSSSVYITYAPVSEQSIYIEGFKITKPNSSWTRVVDVTSSNDDLSLYINKCYIVAGNDQYPFEPSDQLFDTLEIKNCYFQRGYAHIINANWPNVTTGGQILKTHFNNAYNCYSCVGSAAINDNVTTTTSGYGPEYGEYYKRLVLGYFDGYIFQEGLPVERSVRLHRRDNGGVLGETTSSGDGGYYIETSYSGSHYIVALDDAAGDAYNDLIIGNVYPTTFSGA